MQRLVVVSLVAVLTALACNPPPPQEGEGEAGEGEGEGEGEEGEGEGEEGEGEGEEGEGEAGEGEGEGGPGGVCNGDGDCGGSDVCLFSDDAFILDGVCGAAPAGGAVGDPCAPGGGDCARGLCIDNRCSQLCESAAECAAGQECSSQSFTLDNGAGGGLAGICVGDLDLPETPCDSDADCAATGRLCNTLNDAFQLRCGFSGGGADAGGRCESEFFENRAQCQTGLCDGERAGMCTRACTSNADCGDAGGLCSASPFSNVEGNYCAQPCLTNAGCTLAPPVEATDVPRTCGLRDNIAGTGLDQVCIDPPGTKGFGEPAASSLECTTNLVFGGRCTRMCSGGGCEGPLPNCTAVGFRRPSGDPDDLQPVTICGT